MAFSSFFSGEARRARRHRKALKKAVDKLALSSERIRALEELRDDGTAEAILGMMRRFNLQYEKSIEDEQEKAWVCDALCALGARRVLPVLRTYLQQSDTIAWALRVLERLATKEQLLAQLEELCEQNDNGYARDPGKKIQLLHFMGEQRDPMLVMMLAPYLRDMNEGVRYTATEALLSQGEAARAVLEPVVSDEAEESLRIKSRIVEGLAELRQAPRSLAS